MKGYTLMWYNLIQYNMIYPIYYTLFKSTLKKKTIKFAEVLYNKTKKSRQGCKGTSIKQLKWNETNTNTIMKDIKGQSSHKSYAELEAKE